VGYDELLRISSEIKTTRIMARQLFQIKNRAKDMNIGYFSKRAVQVR
jgi:hypothetical protein